MIRVGEGWRLRYVVWLTVSRAIRHIQDLFFFLNEKTIIDEWVSSNCNNYNFFLFTKP